MQSSLSEEAEKKPQKTDYAGKYGKWIEKKLSDKPGPMRKFLRRSYNSGLMVLAELDGIPFDKLSSSLYFICQDMRTENLSRKYDSLLELAGANPDRFMAEIHKGLNDVSKYIKNNDLLPEFCEFISACDRLRVERSVTDMDIWHIMTAYMDLLVQTCAYLTPSRFDFKQRICGCSTAGEALLCGEYYPYADDIAMQTAEELEKEPAYLRRANIDAVVARLAAQYGYSDITSYKDLDLVLRQDIFHSAQIGCLITYISEYTYDMLPDTKHIFNHNVDALHGMQIHDLDFGALVRTLSNRARTLPGNGLLVEFAYEQDITSPDRLQTLLMKETLHDDRIVMLYKLRFSEQDLCGYYDTKDNFFHSLFLEVDRTEEIRPYHDKICSVILYLYAAATSREGEKMFLDFGLKFQAIRGGVYGLESPITAKPYFRGGKLRNTYLEGDKPYNPSGPRIGDDRYEQEERSIQGYIRKVGKGRTPSQEAVARAEALGFALEPDETYVQPFTRHVLRLRRK